MGAFEGINELQNWDVTDFDEPIYTALLLAVGPPPRQTWNMRDEQAHAIIAWDNAAVEWLDEAGHNDRRWGLSQACIAWWKEQQDDA